MSLRSLPVLAVLGAGIAAAQPGRIVQLPPLIVSAEGNAALRWRYASAPGFEVLSLCPDDQTTAIMQTVARLDRLLPALLPVEFQARRSAPNVFILFTDSDRWRKNLSQEVVSAMGRVGGVSPADPGRIQLLPNLNIGDLDDATNFMLVPSAYEAAAAAPITPWTAHGFASLAPEDDPSSFLRTLALTPFYVRYLLEQRTPPLPPWCVEGIMGVYGLADFGDRFIRLAPASWPAAVGKAAAPELPPLPELLAPRPPPAGPGQEAARHFLVWQAEAALFARWALDGDAARRQAYWRLVDRATAAPVTEAVFRQCCGQDYAGMRAVLGAYLHAALTRTVAIDAGEPAAPPAFEPRKATGAEVARLIGEAERIEAGFLRTQSPEYAQLYLTEARQLLLGAVRRGERDPRVLAALGLCDCDGKDDSAARAYLDAAARAGVAHPRVYAELARIELADGRARPADAAGNLAPERAAAVWRLLETARRQSPALPQTYALMTEVLLHSSASPTRAQLDALDEGAEFFPRIPVLSYRAAIFEAHQGYWARAVACLDRTLAVTTDPGVRQRFAALRQVLAADGSRRGPSPSP